jgi:hypothetical protein
VSDVGGPFSSLVTDKHPSYKKALRNFKKNALIKMYFANEKSTKNKDELVREDGSYKLNPFLKDAFNWLEAGAKEGFSPDKFHNLIYNAFHARREDLVKDAYKDWPNFDFTKAEKVIKDFFPASLGNDVTYRYRVEKFKELILSLLPNNIKQSKEELDKIKSTASKLATKKLKITEASNDNSLSQEFSTFFKNLRKKYDSLNVIRNRIKSFIKNWDNLDIDKARVIVQEYYQFLIKRSSPAREEALKTEMELVLEVFPLGIKETQRNINQLKNNASKLATKKLKITEALQTVKFRYMSARHDPVPEVKVLDTEYPGAEGQKTYGQRQDILGWNLNYFENKKEAKKTIDEIDDFAKILGADKKQKYERIKMLFPEQASYLRRYIKDNCKGVKIKEEGLWRPADWDEIKHLNTQSF